MARWAAILAAWAGLAPGNDESAGKRRSGKTRKGNPWLREALVEAARAAARTRSSYLSAQYHRLAEHNDFRIPQTIRRLDGSPLEEAVRQKIKEEIGSAARNHIYGN